LTDFHKKSAISNFTKFPPSGSHANKSCRTRCM